MKHLIAGVICMFCFNFFGQSIQINYKQLWGVKSYLVGKKYSCFAMKNINQLVIFNNSSVLFEKMISYPKEFISWMSIDKPENMIDMLFAKTKNNKIIANKLLIAEYKVVGFDSYNMILWLCNIKTSVWSKITPVAVSHIYQKLDNKRNKSSIIVVPIIDKGLHGNVIIDYSKFV